MIFRRDISSGVMLLAGVSFFVALPFFAGGYGLALAINVLMFVCLSVAWTLFSGPTAYISLATAAFFGIGAYTVAVLGEVLPWPMILVAAGMLSFTIALVLGFATLRLRGAYFVIFSFGLAELIRQLVSWYEATIAGSVGRYVFLDIKQSWIVWQLTALAVAVLVVGWLINRSRYGLALRVIGSDETVALHSGINTTAVKLVMFSVTAVFMALAGAIVAPRWTYIDASIAFNPIISFQVVIMVLLGGMGKLKGAVLGAIPLVLLFEYLSANFPNAFSLLLGIVFLLIVYLLPNGVIGLFDRDRSAGGKTVSARILGRKPA